MKLRHHRRISQLHYKLNHIPIHKIFHLIQD